MRIRPFSRVTAKLRSGILLLVLGAGVLELHTACQKKATSNDPKVARGQILFSAHCISCHNANTALDGALGPAIKGSSLELVEARVLRGEYPAGYNPKRPTHIMQKLPLTEENVADIVAYLNTP